MKLKSLLTYLTLAALLLLSACVEEKGKIEIKFSDKNVVTPATVQSVLSNLPSNPSSNVIFSNITVSGSLVTQYKFALIQDHEICSLAAYSGWLSSSIPITGPISTGGKKLCVKGKSADGDVQANATEHTWYHDNSNPTWTSFELRDNSNGSATATDSFTVNAVGASSDTPTPLSYCYRTSPSAPSLGDGCWSTNATQSVVIASATTTIYAWVKDSVNNMSGSSSDTIAVQYPIVALTNAPSNPSSSTPLNVTVGGTYVGAYDYVITNQSTSCNAVAFPNTWPSYLSPITQIPADGLNRLCVKGRTAGGIESTSTYQHDWLQDSTAPSVLSFSLRDMTDNSSTGSDSYTVNGIFSATGTPAPLQYCLSSVASTPTPGDVCWNVSSTQSIVIGFSTSTVYGWVRDAYHNVSSSSSDTITLIYPITSLTNLPTNPSTSSPMNVTVGGYYVSTYDYAITDQVTDCSVATYTNTWIGASSTPISAVAADGLRRLCVKTRTAGGIVSTSTTVYDWFQDAGSPIITAFELRDQSDSSTSTTDSKTVDAVFVSVTGTTPTHFCVQTTSTTPLVGDGCWIAGATRVATIVNSSTTIYGWAKDASNKISNMVSDTIKYKLGICDDGDLNASSSPCYISTAKNFANAAVVSGSGSLIIETGGSFNGNSAETMTINMGTDVSLVRGAAIRANLSNLIATNLIIDASSTINVNYKGYQGVVSGNGNGTLGGQGLLANGNGTGGGHGGAGGGNGNMYVIYYGGGIYGSSSTPTYFGSAGGGTNWGTNRGGHGGGAVRITVSGSMLMSGSILANGENGTGTIASIGSGGGAGGSVWITAGSMSGTGTISANGGNGVDGSGNYDGSGGGGGRIAVVTPSRFNSMSVQAIGGIGYAEALPGQTGTVYFNNLDNYCTNGDWASTCTINGRYRFENKQAFSGVNLTIGSGGAMETASTSAMAINLSGNAILQNGGKILGNLTNFSASSLSIDASSTINASYLGYQGVVSGSGNGTSTGGGQLGSGMAAGGAHGGNGGNSGLHYVVYSGGNSYGSSSTPVTYGSAGGGNAWATMRGGHGGGAIKITISGALTLGGSILANGENGYGDVSTITTGGGAGGSIWISAGSMSGTGTISANGGNGADGSATYDSAGAGGGRIAIYTASTLNGMTVRTLGGSGVALGQPGQTGTVYFNNLDNYCNSGNWATTCTISSRYRFENKQAFSGANLVIGSGGVMETASTSAISINLSGSATLQNGGKILANLSDFTATSLSIDASSTIDASSLGYQGVISNTGNGTSTGGGVYGNGNSAGGGHGGTGGNIGKWYVVTSGGGSYGSSSTPSAYGSAGGGVSWATIRGGHGGGAIRLNISGALSNNGNILANGEVGHGDPSTLSSGGGAGGSIWISAGSMSGAGLVSANGGDGMDGSASYDGGGGGGGRVAIHTSSRLSSMTVRALGGGGYAEGMPGQTGTVYFTNLDNYCSSGDWASTCTMNSRYRYENNQGFTGANLVIGSGGVMETASTSFISIALSGNATLQNGGKILANLKSFTMTNLSIDASSTIDATTLGYQGMPSTHGTGTSTGRGIAGSNEASGAGHGGWGGSANSGVLLGGSTYGATTTPTALGSGGGGMTSWNIRGGHGGGAIKLNASGILTLNGSIVADGEAGYGDINTTVTGGGSGGSLWISAKNLLGTGKLSAKGGHGIDGSGGYDSGGGGGGRIALYSDTPLINGTVTYSGGTSTGISALAGGIGSYNWMPYCDSGAWGASSTCVISSARVFVNGTNLNAQGSLQIDGAAGTISASPTYVVSISVSENISIINGGSIKANLSDLVANSLTIDGTSSINVDGLGEQGLTTSPGAGAGASSANGQHGAGAGHGGRGGDAWDGSMVEYFGGGIHGNYQQPTTLGSSAGGASACGTPVRGGHGGGRVKISANTVNLNGIISANGTTGLVNCTRSMGGGAGGSIWITSSTVTGTSGVIRANGGASSAGAFAGGGGGAGGRVAIEASNKFNPGLTVQVIGGANGNAGSAADGEIGSIYFANNKSNFCSSGTLPTTCTISQAYRFQNSDTFTVAGSLTLANNGQLYLNEQEAMTVNVGGTLTIQSGGSIRGNLNDLVATNLMIESGGSINANSKGELGVYGLGVSPGYGTITGGGAAHGGRGGNGYAGGGSTALYGNRLQPITTGSAGGGTSPNERGGSGGGKIKISVSNTISVTGTISANGGDGDYGPADTNEEAGGGGSGGSIWMSAQTLQGNGTISANGGNGGGDVTDETGGGGGGGRVSINYVNDYFFGDISSFGGAAGSTTYSKGNNGTLCLNNSGIFCEDNSNLANSGLATWLMANRGISKDGSNNITQWRDQGGKNVNVVTITSDPQWNAIDSNANNQPYIDFDGNDMLQTAAGKIASSTSYTLIVVGRSDAITGTSMGFISFSAGNYSTSDFVAVSNNQGYVGYGSYASGISNVLANYISTQSLSPHIITGSHAVGIDRLKVNTRLIATATSTASAIMDPNQELDIGAFDHSGTPIYYLDGRIYELLVYTRELSMAEQQRIEGYLAAKYNIPISETSTQLAWFSADRGVKSDTGCSTAQTTNNGVVGCWQDQSGRGNNATAPGTSPGLILTSINNKPAIDFSTDVLQTSSIASSTRSLIGVFQRLDDFAPGTAEVPLRAVNATTGKYMALAIDTGNEYSLSQMASSTAFGVATTGDGAASTSPMLVTGDIDSMLNLYISGKLINSIAGHDRSYGSNILSIGAGSSIPGNPFDGQIAEVFAHSSGLSYYQQSRIEAYLAQKYGANYTPLAPLNAQGLWAWWSADRGIVSDEKAAQFTNANSESLSIADNASLSTGDIDFSMSAWVYLDSKTAWRQLVVKWDGSGSQGEYAINYDQGLDRFNFGVSSNGSSYVNQPANTFGSPSLGTWYFITVWHDSVNNQVGIQVNDSAPDVVSYSSGVFDSISPFTVGVSGSSNYHDGRVAKVGFWKKVLSAAERIQLYNKGHGLLYSTLNSGLKTSLTSYWNLDEASGTRNDSHGTNHLTDNNTVTQANFEPGMSEVTYWLDQSGSTNTAYQGNASLKPTLVLDGGSSINNRPVVRFDGTGDVLQIFRAMSGNINTMFVVAKNNDAVNGSIMLGQTTSSRSYFAVTNNGIQVYPETGTNFGSPVASMTNWYIMTAKSDGTNYYTYENGGDQQSSAISGNFIANTIGGYNNASFYMDGDIAEIILYKQNLSTAEKQAVECYLSAKYNIALIGISCP